MKSPRLRSLPQKYSPKSILRDISVFYLAGPLLFPHCYLQNYHVPFCPFVFLREKDKNPYNIQHFIGKLPEAFINKATI